MPRRILRLAACLFPAVACWASGGATASAATPLSFNRDVRPILSESCFKCHGFDEKQRQAGLRLDTADGAAALLDSGLAAVAPGRPDESELLKRLTTDDPDLVMPPPGSGKTITPAQIETLRQWIAEGAPYEAHWSFVTPVKPELPHVADEDWPANPIDRFVLARLEQAGLTPNPQADRETLIRRLTLDLTGLPPTLEEVEAFVSDPSPMAYEQAVDRLLASPRYGEHMARHWLDLARYGDTHGLHLDNERSMWKYRDWVIDAWNRNLPFDDFTIEQVAGDLLPEPTLDQRIATGFNRCNVTTSEGGAIDEEWRIRYAIDRTETIGTVFLGLTLGCAVCHDHKYDPIRQADFYSLLAFYGSTADPAMDGNRIDTPPIMKVPTSDEQRRLAGLDARIAELQAQIAQTVAATEYHEPEQSAAVENEPQEVVWIEDEAPAGAKLEGNTPWEFVSRPDHPVHSGEKSTRREGSGVTQHFFTGASSPLVINEGDRLFAYVYVDPQNPPKTVMLQFNDGTWEHRAFWGEDAIPFGAGDTDGHRHLGPLPTAGEWVRLEVEAAHVGLKPGAALNGWAFTQYDGLCYWDQAGVVTRKSTAFESQIAWESYEKSLETSPVPQPVRDAIRIDESQRTDEQRKQVRDYFVEHVCASTRPVFAPLQASLEAARKERTDAEAAIPVTLIMAELPQPRDTFILMRGEYDQPTDKVDRSVPQVLPPLPEGAPQDRLGLAQWLVHPSQPLTSRVTVNRFWQQLFGRGLVKTPEDFGSQGDWPSHPELLDWLAVDIQEHGWDVKRFLKQVVLSQTYRQSSVVTPEKLERDPENRLLSRGPRFRVDAEVVRDSALAVSGLLQHRLGGKSVKPYQPDGLWEAVAFTSSNTNAYQRDTGEGLYRRSMYTFWKRTSPPAALTTFDAPSRENCTAQRPRTNTPLQALALMNDEQYVEASRFLAERMIREGGGRAGERLELGFRLITARRPCEAERAVLQATLDRALEKYRSDPEAAGKLLGIGEKPRDAAIDVAEHAAYTLVANLLLNLDEAVTRE
ncbi:MAG: PSD1 domain-containing protein [Planctomyces sp.]|nr:PSD1 domain-containing protein [Planctomyces sp.]